MRGSKALVLLAAAWLVAGCGEGASGGPEPYVPTGKADGEFCDYQCVREHHVDPTVESAGGLVLRQEIAVPEFRWVTVLQSAGDFRAGDTCAIDMPGTLTIVSFTVDEQWAVVLYRSDDVGGTLCGNTTYLMFEVDELATWAMNPPPPQLTPEALDMEADVILAGASTIDCVNGLCVGDMPDAETFRWVLPAKPISNETTDFPACYDADDGCVCSLEGDIYSVVVLGFTSDEQLALLRYDRTPPATGEPDPAEGSLCPHDTLFFYEVAEIPTADRG